MGNSLFVAKVPDQPGRARFTWRNTATPPTNYSILEDTAKDRAFETVLATGEDGAGLEATLGSASRTYFYRVAGRNGEHR